MTYEYSLDNGRRLLVLISCGALAVLFFAAGWISEMIFLSYAAVPDTPPVSPAEAKLGFTVAKPLSQTIETEFARYPESEKMCFTVVAGGFQNKEGADQWVTELTIKGYDSYVRQIWDSRNEAWHTVLIGKYENQESASEAYISYTEKEKLPAYLSYFVPHPQKKKKNEKVFFYPYTLRLASYRLPEHAREGVAYYKKKDLSPYIMGGGMGKKMWWNVYTGHYKTEMEALRAKKENKLSKAILREMHYANFIDFFPSEDKMSDMCRRLEALGYVPCVIRTESDTLQLFAGMFITREAAEEQNRKLRADDIRSQLVEAMTEN